MDGEVVARVRDCQVYRLSGQDEPAFAYGAPIQIPGKSPLHG